jgi:hypothetical protein
MAALAARGTVSSSIRHFCAFARRWLFTANLNIIVLRRREKVTDFNPVITRAPAGTCRAEPAREKKTNEALEA